MRGPGAAYDTGPAVYTFAQTPQPHNEGDFSALGQIVDAAMAIAHSDMGNIQLYDPAQRHLKIVAHRGFAPPFLAFWNAVSANEGTCGTALGHGERVFVEDIRTSVPPQKLLAIYTVL